MKRFITTLLWLLYTLNICAQTMSLDSLANQFKLYEGKNNRPKIGLVLAGGGAKGAAHIGVIREIEKYGIPIDYITGTSMGSIIGGLYALGYTADEMDNIISELDWSLYMSDNIRREGSSSHDKLVNNQYLLTVPFNTRSDIKTNIREKSQQDSIEYKRRQENKNSQNAILKSLPGGFISGNNVLNLLNSLCIGYLDSISFDDLPIQFACVTTDAITGEEYVFRSGFLPLAIRASMAIPGVFAPVKYDGRVLVDGGMVNNFPVDICKDMGADIIIGSEVSSIQTTNADNVSSLPSLIGLLMGIVTKGHNADNRKICDIYIHPDISGFSTMSFEKNSIKTLINRGREGALIQEKKLQALSDFLKNFPEEKKSRRRKP